MTFQYFLLLWSFYPFFVPFKNLLVRINSFYFEKPYKRPFPFRFLPVQACWRWAAPASTSCTRSRRWQRRSGWWGRRASATSTRPSAGLWGWPGCPTAWSSSPAFCCWLLLRRPNCSRAAPFWLKKKRFPPSEGLWRTCFLKVFITLPAPCVSQLYSVFTALFLTLLKLSFELWRRWGFLSLW